MIGFSEIRNFPMLVNKSRICDKDNKAKANYYKAVIEKRGRDFGRGNPYNRGGRRPDEGGSSGGK
ncbi:hypothetical protein A2U01_0085336 [Trifolium medium]|uniref:Cellular nucleic acid-binding protein n=1 Tax=Trifolium medium TaxID=97028 RepID=A0A392TT58_9FABA|nr:hypothetical protein [Trifolium medium]